MRASPFRWVRLRRVTDLSDYGLRMDSENIALLAEFDDLASSLERHADGITSAAHRDGIDPAFYATVIDSIRSQAQTCRQLAQNIREGHL